MGKELSDKADECKGAVTPRVEGLEGIPIGYHYAASWEDDGRVVVLEYGENSEEVFKRFREKHPEKNIFLGMVEDPNVNYIFSFRAA